MLSDEIELEELCFGGVHNGHRGCGTR